MNSITPAELLELKARFETWRSLGQASASAKSESAKSESD